MSMLSGYSRAASIYIRFAELLSTFKDDKVVKTDRKTDRRTILPRDGYDLLEVTYLLQVIQLVALSARMEKGGLDAPYRAHECPGV